MARILTTIAAVSVMAGCSVPLGTSRVINLENTFDVRAAQAQTKPGTGLVSGSALMPKRGGDMATCAGNEVHLVPATKYAEERFGHMYPGTPTAATTSVKSIDEIMFRHQAFFPDPPEYRLAMKVTTCDDQGNFEFTDVLDGDYFVNTTVYWKADTREGAALAKRVTVANGVTQRLILTP